MYQYRITEKAELAIAESLVRQSSTTEKKEADYIGDLQYEVLNKILEKFGREEFTLNDVSQKLSIRIKSASYNVRKLFEHGYLHRKWDGGKYIYWLTDRSFNEKSTDQKMKEPSPDTTITEEQSERLRARLEQKHPAHNNPTQGDVAQETALVAAG